MNVNMFSMGGLCFKSYVGKIDQTCPPVSKPHVNSSGFSTWSLLKHDEPHIILEEISRNVGVEDYEMNTDQHREKAILLAASTLKIGKNEDGTIWVESATSPQELLARKRASGGEKQISWDYVETSLNGHTMGILDTVAIDIDYFASEYAQYKTRIEQQYTGEEQKTELVKLENMFASRVGEAAANFAEQVGGFLEANGVTGEQDAIRNSFLDIYEQRKTNYLNFIVENPDYAHVKGTEDEWLLTAGGFMGEQLRYAYISQQPEMNLTSQYGYSVDDLNAAGTLAKELTSIERNLSESSERSEEELGVELGLAAMRYVVISGHFAISSNVKSKLDQSLNTFVKRQMEKAIASIDWHRRDPYTRDKEAYAIDFDQQVVLAVIKRMVKDLSSAEDINTAFKSDFNTFVALYKKKSSDLLMGSLSRYTAFYSSSWLNKNYATDWNRFVRQLSATNREEASRYLLNDQMKLVDISV